MSPRPRPAPGSRARRARAGEGRLRRALPLLAALAAPATAQPEVPPAASAPLPSGQQVTPHDLYLERQHDGQDWLVLRYLAPRIGRDAGDLGYADVAGDLDALCAGPGRAVAGALDSRPDQIVVTLMDRPVPRGESAPAATRFLAAYALVEGRCEWR